MTHLVAVGGSDAGISAALRPRTQPQRGCHRRLRRRSPERLHLWHPLLRLRRGHALAQPRHRTAADLEAAGLQLRLDTLATRIDVADTPAGTPPARPHPGRLRRGIPDDALVVGTGAVPFRPAITGLTGRDALGPDDGVHLLHSMGDNSALTQSLDRLTDGGASAVIVGVGYIGLEMAESLTARGLRVTQIEALPEVLPTVDAELGALVHAELDRHDVEVLTGTTVTAITRSPGGTARLCVEAQRDGDSITREVDLVLLVVGVLPDTDLAVSARASVGIRGGIDVDGHMRTGLRRRREPGRRSPSPPRPTTTRPTTLAPRPSPFASQATATQDGCSALASSATAGPRSPSVSTSTPPRSTFTTE